MHDSIHIQCWNTSYVYYSGRHCECIQEYTFNDASTECSACTVVMCRCCYCLHAVSSNCLRHRVIILLLLFRLVARVHSKLMLQTASDKVKQFYVWYSVHVKAVMIFRSCSSSNGIVEDIIHQILPIKWFTSIQAIKIEVAPSGYTTT